MDMYLGKKECSKFKLGLGEEVVQQLTRPMEKSFCADYFDNYFNNPNLVKKLFGKKNYVIGTVRSNIKPMPRMTNDQKMKQDGNNFLFSKTAIPLN